MKVSRVGCCRWISLQLVDTKDEVPNTMSCEGLVSYPRRSLRASWSEANSSDLTHTLPEQRFHPTPIHGGNIIKYLISNTDVCIREYRVPLLVRPSQRLSVAQLPMIDCGLQGFGCRCRLMNCQQDAAGTVFKIMEDLSSKSSNRGSCSVRMEVQRHEALPARSAAKASRVADTKASTPKITDHFLVEILEPWSTPRFLFACE